MSMIYVCKFNKPDANPTPRGFQRTCIEHFFKIVKHILKIQESRIRNKDEFSFKFLRFAFIALHIQKMIQHIRRKIKRFKNKGFITIQRILRKDKDFEDFLQRSLLSIT